MVSNYFRSAMTGLLSIVLILLFIPLNTHAAGQKITVHSASISVGDALKIVERESDYVVLADYERLNKLKPIAVDVRDATVSEYLYAILTKINYVFEFDGKTIVIVPSAKIKNKPTSPVLSAVVSKQQRVQGRVIDENARPLEGVTVRLVGKAMSTRTDVAGRFSLAVSERQFTLSFSAIGYKTVQQKAEAGQELTVSLTPEASDLEEVVVVGYGSQRKINLTGAVSTVNAEVLESRVIANLGQGLQGVVPNLNITSSDGRPGTGASFNIRGYTSINGGSPLVLVDGVQIDPNQINPDDVQSVTVLKDAASAAVYGGRAAYGVVLITTKAGKLQSPIKVTYNFNQSMARPTVLPDPVNSLKYIEMYREASATGALTGGATGSENFTDLDVQKVKEFMANPIPQNAVYIDPNNPSLYRYVSNTNWMKESFPGWQPVSQHDLNLSGGGEKYSFYSSFGTYREKGLFKAANQVFKRYNGNVNLTIKPVKWLDINTRLRLNRKENDQPASTSINGIVGDRFFPDSRPLMPIRHPDGHFSGQGGFSNPFAVIASGGRNKYSSDDIWLTGGFTLRPLKNIQVVGDLTWNSYHYNSKNNTKAFLEYGAVPAGEDITDPSKAVVLGYYPHNLPATVGESNSHDIYTAINAYAQYENTFAKVHYLKVMLGYNQEYKRNESFSASVRNLLNQDYPFLALNNDPKPGVGSSIGDWALMGQFFRVNYIFNSKYLLEVNGRYDGSSRFSARDRYVFSPSVSLGWRLSEESFIKSLLPSFDNLKLRASYGKLPNQALTALYPYIATMPYGQTAYPFGSIQQTYVSAPGLISSSFSWEEVTSRNIGLDFSLIRSKLSGSLDFFRRDTRGMIVGGLALPTILGTSAPSRNAADLKTTGFELELTWRDKLNKKFNYFVSANLSDNRAEITKYDLNPTGSLSGYYVGRKIGEIWGYTSSGLYQSDEEAAVTNKTRIWGGKWLAGDVNYTDLNGDGAIDYGNNTLENRGDLSIIGNNQARYSYGLRTGFEWGAFDFTTFFQGVGKRDLMLGSSYFWGFTSEWAVPTNEQTDYWTEDNRGAYYPRQRFGGGGNFQTQTRYLQNAAYLRLKQITVGYNPKFAALGRVGIKSARIFLTGQNVFTITKILGSYDPEQSDRQAYPLNRSFALGVQLSL